MMIDIRDFKEKKIYLEAVLMAYKFSVAVIQLKIYLIILPNPEEPSSKFTINNYFVIINF